MSYAFGHHMRKMHHLWTKQILTEKKYRYTILTASLFHKAPKMLNGMTSQQSSSPQPGWKYEQLFRIPLTSTPESNKSNGLRVHDLSMSLPRIALSNASERRARW